MSKFAFERDNVLTFEERQVAARKCVNILRESVNAMTQKEADFVDDMTGKVEVYGASERQLAWLRDLVEKYA
jgi:hypothetical protein